MNDEKATSELKPRKSPMERLGENIELLSKRFEKTEEDRENDNLQMTKAGNDIKLLKYDLSDPKRGHGYTPTREVAVAALKQSQGFISVDNLEGHSVIKDITESLQNYATKVNGRLADLRHQIEAIPKPTIMDELLNRNWTFKEMEKQVNESESRLDKTVREINDMRETYNGHDHPTGPEFDELKSDYETLRTRHDELVHFLMGVFSSMKMDPVTKCIENYKVSVAE